MTGPVLVAGASGALGGRIVAELQRRGERVRVLVRDPARAARFGTDVDVHRGDALRPDSLRGACDGARAIISALGASVLPFPSRGRATFSRVDTPANRAIVVEAERAGVERFVYVSVFGADKMRGLDYIDAHERVVEAIDASRLNGVIIRPTGFFSAFDSFVAMARGGAVYGFGDGNARSNPIDDGDLARVCVDGLDGAPGERAVGGPEVLSRREIAERAIAAVGGRAKIRNMPIALARTLSWCARPFIPRVGHLLAFFATISEMDLIAPIAGQATIDAYFREVARR